MKKACTYLLLVFAMQMSNAQLNDLKKSIEREINTHHQFSGSLLVLKKDKEVFKRHNGFSDSSANIRNSDSTLYKLASLSKVYTMLGILKLSERGAISLEDSIGSYISDFKDPRAGNITIRDLLSHRSGWGHYWENANYIKMVDSLKTNKDFLTFIREMPLDFDPGSSYQYSNVGYILLGVIIEEVSKQDYYTFIRENVLTPMKLTSTFFRMGPTNNPRIAQSYSMAKSIPVKTSMAWADGGAFASILDIEKLLKQVFIYQSLLSTNSFNEIMDGFQDEGDDIFELQGGFPGTSTSLFYHARTGYSIIALANQDPPIAEDVSRSVIQIISDYVESTATISIEGITYNSATDEPIPYVNIGIVNQGVGTASNGEGKYTLEIPRAHLSDTLTFSALGFKTIYKTIASLIGIEQFSPAFEERQESLEEVVVYGQKLMKGTLGTIVLSPLASGAYIGGGRPGATLVTLIEPPKFPTYINTIKVHVTGNKKKKLFKLRLRILTEENGHPAIDLLQESIIIESSIESGWITFEFDSNQIELNNNVFIGVEWIEEPGNKVNARNAYPRISYTQSNKIKSFARKTSLDKWGTIEIKPAIKVKVEF